MNVSRILTRRRLVWLGLIGLLLLPLFVPVPIDWRQHPLVGALGDRVHVAMFAVLVIVLYHRGPWRGRLLTVVVIAMVAGGMSEFVQHFAGRSPAFWDWYQDAQGAVLAGCWLAWRHHRARWWPALVGAAVLVSIAWPLRLLPLVVPEVNAALDRFPVLGDFERPHSAILWSSHQGSEVRRVELADGDHVLEVTHDGAKRWPGTDTGHLAWNWTGHDSLLVDVRLIPPSPDSLRVTLWLKDAAAPHDLDYGVVTRTVGHDWTTLAMPLHEILTYERGRHLRLRNVVAFSVFLHRGPATGLIGLQIDDVRLTPDD